MGVTSTVGEGSASKPIYDVNDQVNVVLAKVEENNFTWENKPVEKWRWHFTVLDEGPWKDETITGDTSQKFVAHPDCRAYKWASEIAGSPYPVGYEFDSAELVGMRCRILIGHKPSKKSETVFMTATDVMGPRDTVAAPIANPPTGEGMF